MHDPRTIANYVLDRAEEYGRQITNLDLQKILYFLHGHFLCQHHKPLVNLEFEAWTYGPVSKIVYDSFKAYNDLPINGRATKFNPFTRSREELPSLSDEAAIAIVDQFLGKYLKMSTYSLVNLTHKDGTPWSRTVSAADKQINIGMRIPNSLITEYFEGHLQTT
jgi:uncharacterized phage-associated protein